jgi:hypothetical protein
MAGIAMLVRIMAPTAAERRSQRVRFMAGTDSDMLNSFAS